MKSIKFLFGALAAAALFVGCEKTENLGDPKLELGGATVDFETTAEASRTFTFIATRDWKVTEDAEWLTVEPAQGKGSAKEQTVTISVTENQGSKHSAEVTFSIGTVQKKLTVTQHGSPVLDGSSIVEESFKESLGTFTTDAPTIWTLDTQYKCAKATAYQINNAPEESWLLSGEIDLTTEAAATLVFEHAGKFFQNVDALSTCATLWVKEVGAADWTQLTIPVYFALDFAFVSSGDIDLSAYLGKKIQLGFKYAIGAAAGTWEIKYLKVQRRVAAKVLEASTLALTPNAVDTEASFTITSNTSWEVTSDNPAFVVSPATGTNDGTVKVTFPANTSDAAEVTATLTITGENANPVTITITQGKALPANAKTATISTEQIDWTAGTANDATYGPFLYFVKEGFTVTNFKYKSIFNLYSTKQNHIRIYKDSAFQIEAPAGKTMISIKITCMSSNKADIVVLSDSNKTVALSGNDLVWTGSTAKFLAHMANGQCRITSIEVTYTE